MSDQQVGPLSNRDAKVAPEEVQGKDQALVIQKLASLSEYLRDSQGESPCAPFGRTSPQPEPRSLLPDVPAATATASSYAPCPIGWQVSLQAPCHKVPEPVVASHPCNMELLDLGLKKGGQQGHDVGLFHRSE